MNAAVTLRRCLVCLPVLLSGCTWLPYAYQNLTGAPLSVAEDYYYGVEIRMIALQAWKKISDQCPEDKDRSQAYLCGFLDGFAQYTGKDGTGDPPAVVPRCYRYPVLRTLEQQQRIQDWFAGYRRGAQTAKEQGWRNGVVVPINLPPRPTYIGYQEEFIPYPPPPEPKTPIKGPPLEEVPTERAPPPRELPEPVRLQRQGQPAVPVSQPPQGARLDFDADPASVPTAGPPKNAVSP